MCGFARTLAFGGQLCEIHRFSKRKLGDLELAVCRCKAEIEATHGGYEPSARNFHFGCRKCCCRIGATNRGDLRESQLFIDDSLAGVLANGVICDELRRRLGSGTLSSLIFEAIWFCVEVLIVVNGAGQKIGTGNGAVKACNLAVGDRSRERRLIDLGTMDSLFERDNQRLRCACGGAGLQRCLRNGGLRMGHERREERSASQAKPFLERTPGRVKIETSQHEQQDMPGNLNFP